MFLLEGRPSSWYHQGAWLSLTHCCCSPRFQEVVSWKDYCFSLHWGLEILCFPPSCPGCQQERAQGLPIFLSNVNWHLSGKEK